MWIQGKMLNSVYEKVRGIPKKFPWRVRVGIMILRVKEEEVVRKR